MRGIYFWQRLLLRANKRYQSILQAFVFLSVGFGYCFLLGSYALSRQREMVKSRNINITKGPSTQVQQSMHSGCVSCTWPLLFLH
jgi:hypothetical protein